MQRIAMSLIQQGEVAAKANASAIETAGPQIDRMVQSLWAGY